MTQSSPNRAVTTNSCRFKYEKIRILICKGVSHDNQVFWIYGGTHLFYVVLLLAPHPPPPCRAFALSRHGSLLFLEAHHRPTTPSKFLLLPNSRTSLCHPFSSPCFCKIKLKNFPLQSFVVPFIPPKIYFPNSCNST